MFVKAHYFGFYPLGSDIELNGVKIMQLKWNIYKRFVILFGKRNKVSPNFEQLFFVETEGKAIFFAAVEYGLGHYHIFTISDKATKKLSKKISRET